MKVYLEVREQGALGLFSWRSLEVSETDPMLARHAAIDEAHSSGYETRGVTLDLKEVPRIPEWGTMLEGKREI